MFRRKHYRFLLDWAIEANLARTTINSLSHRLQADNPAFDRELFLVTFYKAKHERAVRQRLAAVAQHNDVVERAAALPHKGV